MPVNWTLALTPIMLLSDKPDNSDHRCDFRRASSYWRPSLCSRLAPEHAQRQSAAIRTWIEASVRYAAKAAPAPSSGK